MYRSTKKIGPISTGHRQWRDDGHCSYVHGYGRYVQFTFASDALDGYAILTPGKCVNDVCFR